MVIPRGIYAPVLLLPLTLPALILRPAFYPLEEGGTNLCNVLLCVSPPMDDTILQPLTTKPNFIYFKATQHFKIHWIFL